MLEIKSKVVVVVLITLKHNGLCGWETGSSQLCSQSMTVCYCHVMYQSLE